MTDAAEQVVRAQEDVIRHNPLESAYAFDRQGILVLSKRGAKSEIGFTAAELLLLKDMVLTHNHPADVSLSPSDVELATAADIAEIRVVTPQWRHSLRRPPRGWDTVYFESVLKPAYDRHADAVRVSFVRAIRSYSMTRAAAEAEFHHTVWMQVARELGLQYTRER